MAKRKDDFTATVERYALPALGVCAVLGWLSQHANAAPPPDSNLGDLIDTESLLLYCGGALMLMSQIPRAS